MLIDKFLIYLQHEKRYSLHTVQAYETDLLQFEHFIKTSFEQGLSLATGAQVRSFMVALMEDGISANAINRKISTLRSFYKYLQREETIAQNPMALIKAPKIPKRLPVFVEEDKLNYLLDHAAAFDEGFAGQRDRMVMELLFGTGIRLAELLQLKEQDINRYEQHVKVLGKRNKERIIPLHNALFRQLEAYIRLKDQQKFDNKTTSLIVTDKGAAPYPGLIYQIVNHYLGLVSTQDKKSPHVLRHSFASSLLNRGADLNAIKELLGHAGLAATQVYTHNSIERLKSIYKQAHPKA
ncbi:Tyrosine recombinase XerD [compost metagenome]